MPANTWTSKDLQFLRDNRLLSTSDMAIALDRSNNAIREKRCRQKLPQLAICKTCNEVFQKINQHSQCLECTPDQRGYAKTYKDSLNGRWQMYKSNAKKRGLRYDLSIEEFAKYWQKPCHYCGVDIQLIGIDRIDSSLGYMDDNLVPCCARCNEMKMGYSEEEWIDQMKAILLHRGEIR